MRIHRDTVNQTQDVHAFSIGIVLNHKTRQYSSKKQKQVTAV